MKKLIVYDGSCPMCRLYTKGMVSASTTGHLSRISNDQLNQEAIISRIDRQRARHEIPMVDLDGEETLYGVDTWIYAFGRRSDRIERLLSLRWFRTALQKFYAFISYNRRIIITSAPGRWQLLDLQPDFHIRQRLAFILLAFAVISSLILTGTTHLWPPAFAALVGAQLTISGIYVLVTQSANRIETLLNYIGHLGMSLLIGLFMITLSDAVDWAALRPIGYALMIGQHFIRVYRLGLNPWLSVCFTGFCLIMLFP